MFTESSRVLSFLPQFSRVLLRRSLASSRFSSATLPEKIEETVTENEKIVKQDEFQNFRFRYPEFLPNPDPKFRNFIREKLERRDMLRRRNVIQIPEFYVGSILAVTTSDKHSPERQTKFVGICIMRNNSGLHSTFLLRNVIEHQGVEVLYSLYSPLILKIEVLRLEKRLDDPLYYLRDAPNEYSTFPFDMQKEYQDDSKEVPVNTLKVPLNPRPWLERYERMDLKGAIIPELPEKLYIKAKKVAKPWEKYDLMDEYRKITPEEDQAAIFKEICEDLQEIQKKQKTERRKKEFIKPSKQKLF